MQLRDQSFRCWSGRWPFCMLILCSYSASFLFSLLKTIQYRCQYERSQKAVATSCYNFTGAASVNERQVVFLRILNTNTLNTTFSWCLNTANGKLQTNKAEIQNSNAEVNLWIRTKVIKLNRSAELKQTKSDPHPTFAAGKMLAERDSWKFAIRVPWHLYQWYCDVTQRQNIPVVVQQYSQHFRINFHRYLQLLWVRCESAITLISHQKYGNECEISTKYNWMLGNNT